MADGICGRVRVGAHLGPELQRWLNLKRVDNQPQGMSQLTTHPLDQAGLHGLLARIRDLNLTLLAVLPAEENDR